MEGGRVGDLVEQSERRHTHTQWAALPLTPTQKYPVLPGKGDMSFRPEFLLRRTPMFDPDVAAEVMGYDDEQLEKSEVRFCSVPFAFSCTLRFFFNCLHVGCAALPARLNGV
jgi:hypothetical protein